MEPTESVDLYLIVKTLHILSATILFGTGLGIAFFFFLPHWQGRSVEERLAAARTTVTADFMFTLPSGVIQPLSGLWLIWHGGYAVTEPWLLATYALYILAGLCWLPVVWIQIRLKQMLIQQVSGQRIDQKNYDRLYRLWFILGWPAFVGLIIIFALMVAKPSW